MALACPVCERPQADAEHLANHLAITASLHEDDHAEWLDDHAPGWPDESPPDLGKTVARYADEVDDHAEEGHDHWTPVGEELSGAARDAAPDSHRPSRETERILDEARALTERMAEESEDETEET